MAVSKRLRFEILRRDDHACRYCGRSAPEVKLTVDHVTPEALGGRTEAGNLVTACADCNGGKTSIAPGSPLVADVQADALRWSRAIAIAADGMLADLEIRRARRDEFLTAWNQWTAGSGSRKTTLPIPAGWEDSVDRFISSGLPMPVLLDCVDKAMGNRKIAPDATFRYMCGIAWSRVTELQEAARTDLAPAPTPDPVPDYFMILGAVTEIANHLVDALPDYEAVSFAATVDAGQVQLDDEPVMAHVLLVAKLVGLLTIRPADAQ